MIHSKPSKLTQALIYATISCERFAWYLMLSGLVLALVERGLDKATASESYGLLLLAAYLTPLIGGWFGGKYTLRKSVIIGTATLTLGYGLGTQGYLLPMLGILAIGCGMFKPCLSTLLALLYPAGDPAKVKAMGRYYLAVQLGSLPSAFVGGWLRLHYGWGAAYSAAMLGAFLALVFALLAWRRLVPYKSDLEALVQTSVDLPAKETWQLGPLVTLLTVGALFWAANQQQGSTLTFWAAEHVDRVTRWGTIPPETFASLNPLFVAILTPIVGMWVASGRTRLITAMLVTGVGFGLIMLPSGSTVWGLTASYLLGALGELCLNPFGMSTATDLAPRSRGAIVMAAWLGTSAIGGYVAGALGGVPIWWACWLTMGLCLVGAGVTWLWWPVRGGSTVLSDQVVIQNQEVQSWT
jgi:POT family proton-dependent oligopeptide transporter